MKKLAIALMLIVSAVEMKLQAFDFDSHVELGAGYRRDKFHFKTNNFIAPGTDIQRGWHDINSWTLNGKAEFLTCDHLYMKVEGDYGWIDHANQHIRTLTGNTVVGTFDRRGHNGNVWDAEVAFGYEFSFCCNKYYMIPVVGWRWSGLDLRNGDATVGSTGVVVAGSGARHNVEVNGFLVGFKGGFNIDCDWQAYFGYEYSPLRFRDRYSENGLFAGGYNNRSHSFSGNYAYLGANYILCDGWYVGAKLDWRWNWAKSGSESEAGVNYSTRNTVWQSFGGQLLVGYAF